jgi:zinc/manganese transport system substrate-binding protein
MKALLIASFLLAVLGLTGRDARADGLKIVAAENFYGEVAQQIAGDEAGVTSILTNPNQDPHEFTSSASTAKAVADADVVIYSGIGYDSWMEKLLASGGKKGRVVICVADLIGAKDGDNPHIWYKPETMPALADKLWNVLSPDPETKPTVYAMRARAFKDSMNPVLDKIAAIRAKYEGTPVTATEPVFGYMAEALGLKMLNYDFQIKIMNDAEPGADETVAFEKSLKSKSAKMLFYNSQVTDPTTERLKKIAEDSGVPIVGATETQPPGPKTYVDWMINELNAVEAGLAAKAP